IFYAFRDREMIMGINEEIAGYRLTPSFIRIGGVAHDTTDEFIKRVRDFVKWFPKALEGYHTLLTENKIWTTRTMNIGAISAEEAVNYGLTGPCLRGSGVAMMCARRFLTPVTTTLTFRSRSGNTAIFMTVTLYGWKSSSSRSTSSARLLKTFRLGRFKRITPGSRTPACRKSKMTSARLSAGS